MDRGLLWCAVHAVGLILLLAVGCSEEEKAVLLFGKSVPLESQLEHLAELGLILNPGVDEEQLTTFEDRESLESKPYKRLVEVMGIELEEEPYTPLCNQLWMCDYERVEDHGAYVEVLQRLELMTSGAVKIENARDHVDIEEDRAWIEFDYQGQRIHWDFEVDNDWLDPSILVKYDELLKSSGSPIRIYSNHGDYGQVAFLGALQMQQKKKFDKLTRVKLQPLSHD